MGVMRKDVKGLKDDSMTMKGWCRFVEMERMFFDFLKK